MKFGMLLEDQMRPVPENIKIESFDRITIVTNNGQGIVGDHVLVEGSDEDIKNWLRPFNGFWVNSTPTLQEQKFHVVHITD